MKKVWMLIFALPFLLVAKSDFDISLNRIDDQVIELKYDINDEDFYFAENSAIYINGTIVNARKGTNTIAIETEGDKQLYFIKSELHGPKLFYLNKNATKASDIPLWLSILPPLIAILIALLFKEVIIALFIGIFSGAFIYNGLQFSNLLISLMNVIDKYILSAVADPDHMSIILFSLLIGGMVAVISKNGGMLGIVNLFSKWANSAKNAQLVTWILGVTIFFDDYANTLIVGNAMRPVTDRYKVSREKLAYIVDSTAAPMAAIAFVTTWIGAELGYLQDFISSTSINTEISAYGLFMDSLSYAYYPVLAIIFILMLIWMKRDFGPMYTAEKRARDTGKVSNEIEEMEGEEDLSALDPKKGIEYKWYNAGLPILTVLFVTLLGLFITGHDDTIWTSSEGFFTKVSSTIGNSNSYIALLWSSLSGLLVALILSATQGILTIKQGINMMMKGIQTMFAAIIILIFAWALAKVTSDLHTADYLTNLLQGNFNLIWLPLVVFLLSGVISFSTGSSWGTMAILYPLTLPLAWELGITEGYTEAETIALLLPVISVVLSGSVLGDHCSPISDTTILSSLASQCNHIDHVKTQLPYALVVGGISCVLLIFATLQIPFTISISIGLASCYACIRIFGKKIEA